MTSGGREIESKIGYLAISLIAASVILVEVSVTRVLAYRLFYHYVYLVISTALLGLGAGASFVALRAARGRPIGRRGVVIAALVFALLDPIVLFLVTRVTPMPAISGGKLDGDQVLRFLPMVYVILTALFSAAGVVTAVLFSQFRDRIARLYFFDLVAAAAAAVLSVLVMKYATPLRAFLLAGVLTAGLAVAAGGRILRVVGAVAVAALAFTAWKAPAWFDPADNLYGVKERNKPKEYGWNHQARVDIFGDRIVIDSDAATQRAPLIKTALDERARALSPFHELPFDLMPAGTKPSVAIIGAGGGWDIYNALRRGAARVLAVEINQTIYRTMRKSPLSVYNRPEVVAIEGEGRHTLRARGETYDLIQLSLIDTYTASSSGAYSLSENYLYTVEAFEEYLDHLRPGGVLFITRWEFDPPRETMRLCTMGDAALRHRGVADPSRHMVVVDQATGYGRSHDGFLLFRDPITPEAAAAVVQLATSKKYKVTYLPGADGDNEFYKFFAAPDKQAFFAGYPFLIDPPTDARPFYFQYYRLGQFKGAPKEHWVSSMLYMAQVLLLVTLGLAILFSAAIIVWPAHRLARLAGLGIRRPATAAYFGALGLGFMLVEIPLIQQFTLYLGHPTHALVTILSSLLVFAGVGSLVAGRLSAERTWPWLLAAVAAIVGLSAVLVPWLVHATLGLSFAARLAVTLTCVGAIGALLGLPMTLGVRAIGGAGEAAVAWAWACNGACSVVASCLAMVLLVYFGFPVAVIVGAGCYALAATCLPSLRRPA